MSFLITRKRSIAVFTSIYTSIKFPFLDVKTFYVQVWYPVTPAMGKLSFDGPECIKEV